LREWLRELEDLPASEILDRNSANLTEAIQALCAQINHSFGRTAPAVREMQKDLTEKLRRGDFGARGLRTHPNVGEAPEVIPRHYFDYPKIIWYKNVVENFGRRYAAVEVCRVEATDEDTQHAVAPDPSSRRKRGRPSKREAIMAIIAELIREGCDLRTCKPIVACELIKERARKTGHDVTKGFSDAVIASYLDRYYLLQKSTP
jgi:hypothetical protein